jgi:phosphoesterase RecJ-like protein
MTYAEAAALIASKDNILILTHRRPDGDTIGSSAGLCLGLRQIGKTAYLLYNPELTPRFAPYLLPCQAPADFSPDFIVSVDTASRDMLQNNAGTYAGRVDLAIDHHFSHEAYARETCLDGHCAACGELIMYIVTNFTPLTAEIALPLYLAIASDTGCFRYIKTTPDCHRAAAALMEFGIPYAKINRENFSMKSIRRIRLECLLAQNMEMLDDGKTALVSVSRNDIDRLGIDGDDTEDLASFARQVEGTTVGITIQELTDGTCKISLRSSPELNASEACALLGGGGHPAAAGCTVRGSLQDARAAILDAVRKIRESR